MTVALQCGDIIIPCTSIFNIPVHLYFNLNTICDINRCQDHCLAPMSLRFLPTCPTDNKTALFQGNGSAPVQLQAIT